MLILKSTEDIRKMKIAGEICVEALCIAKDEITIGKTTASIDKVIHEYIFSRNAIPSFLGYRGFPNASCISINEEVIHGIPSNRKISDGDIVSVDVGVIYEGFHGDNAYTFAVGDISTKDKQLLEVTKECLFRAIDKAKLPYRIGDIGYTIESLANENDFSVVKAYTGHGVGKSLHESPDVPSFGRPGRGMRLMKGMTIAIEPMVNIGVSDIVVLDNDWTVVSKDNSRSAHFEMSVAITEDGNIILTDWRDLL